MPALVVAESVRVLESKGVGHPPDIVAAALQSFLTLSGVVCPEEDIVLESLAAHGDEAMAFVDAYRAASATVPGPRRVFTRNTGDFHRTAVDLPEWSSPEAATAAPRW